MLPTGTVRLRVRLRPFHERALGEPYGLFLVLGLALLSLGVCASCVAHASLIEEAWREAVWRSGYPPEEIHRPEVIAPPSVLRNAPLPRDDRNRPVVAQYFPLTHQVRIYARIAMPLRRVLLREFLYAIYFDRLVSRPLDVEALANAEPARSWVEQALARPREP